MRVLSSFSLFEPFLVVSNISNAFWWTRSVSLVISGVMLTVIRCLKAVLAVPSNKPMFFQASSSGSVCRSGKGEVSGCWVSGIFSEKKIGD